MGVACSSGSKVTKASSNIKSNRSELNEEREFPSRIQLEFKFESAPNQTSATTAESGSRRNCIQTQTCICIQCRFTTCCVLFGWSSSVFILDLWTFTSAQHLCSRGSSRSASFISSSSTNTSSDRECGRRG